jgi:hypothetical protein
MDPRHFATIADRRVPDPWDDDEPDDAGGVDPPADPERLRGLLDAAAARLAFPYPLDRPSCSRSKRDGFRPMARRHVEDFLAREVLGSRVADLARASGRHRSTVYRAIAAGKRLAAAAVASGVCPPDHFGPAAAGRAAG